MKQYCRYCVFLCVNNVPYCATKEKCLSESYCKRPNKCKDFVFADVEPEYQDAFGETNGYKPRQPKSIEQPEYEEYEQLSFSDYPEAPYQFDNLTGSMNL